MAAPSRVVGSGVAGPEHPSEHLSGLGQHGQMRVVPVGALVGRRRVFLVRAGAHDRRVQVDGRRVAVGTGAGRPRRGPRVPTHTRQAAKLGRAQRAEDPLGAGAGRHRPEQLRLTPQGVEVRDALGPICQGHHHLGQRDARVVAPPRHLGEHPAEPSGQAAAIGHLAQPHQPAPRHETLTVTGH